MLCSLHKLSDASRVWIYQSTQPFSPFLSVELKTLLRDFLEEWTAHNRSLLTFGDIYYNRFIVIFVDESQVGASGCSIDKSTHFIESLEYHYGLDLLNRQNVAFMTTHDDIEQTTLDKLPELCSTHVIKPETLVFNNLVKTKSEWQEKWIIPISKSWHKRFT